MNRFLLSLAAGLVLLQGCGSRRLVQPPPPIPETPINVPRLERALQEDPDRLDLRLRLIQLYQDQGNFEAEYTLWAKTLQLEDKASHHFLWENGAPMPQRPSILTSSRLQASIERELGPGTEEGTDRALHLSKLGATYFPDRPPFERSRAICYSRRGDPKAAMKCLLPLLRKRPQDPTTLLAMAEVLEKAGKKKEARIYYRKTAKFGGAAGDLAKKKLQGL